MFDISFSAVQAAGTALSLLGIALSFIGLAVGGTLLVANRATVVTFSPVPLGVFFLVGGAILSPAIGHSEWLGSAVFVDRDQTLQLVISATEHGVTDFDCLSDCGRMSVHCQGQITSALHEARQLTLSSQIKRVAGQGGI
jgi:hypothetical protein